MATEERAARSARLRAAFAPLGLSIKDAAAQWGVSYDTLRSNLNGAAPFSYKAARKYAAHLGVDPGWLYAGDEIPGDPATG